MQSNVNRNEGQMGKHFFCLSISVVFVVLLSLCFMNLSSKICLNEIKIYSPCEMTPKNKNKNKITAMFTVFNDSNINQHYQDVVWIGNYQITLIQDTRKKTKTKNSERERERSENVKNTLLMTNY